MNNPQIDDFPTRWKDFQTKLEPHAGIGGRVATLAPIAMDVYAATKNPNIDSKQELVGTITGNVAGGGIGYVIGGGIGGAIGTLIGGGPVGTGIGYKIGNALGGGLGSMIGSGVGGRFLGEAGEMIGDRTINPSESHELSMRMQEERNKVALQEAYLNALRQQ